MHRSPRPLLLATALSLGAAGCDRGQDPGPGPGAALPPYASAAACGACHPAHLAEWERSMHAFSGSDPVLHAMAELASAEPGGSIGQDCLACHAPARVRWEEWLAAGGDPEASGGEDYRDEGISCDVCHSVAVVPPVGDIAYLGQVDPRDPKRGGLRDPLPNDFHESLFDDSYTTSANCAPCHQIDLDDGTGLENTFEEWEDSLFGGFPLHCQDCHMPKYVGRAFAGGPVREDLHRHTFLGVDYAWEDFRGIDREAQLADIRALLQGAVSVDVQGVAAQVSAGGTLAFSVNVANLQTGHSIPSGTSFSREMWISVEARDGAGALLYRSGWTMGPDEDLVGLAADPDRELFSSTLRDAAGDRTFFTWRAVAIDESGLLAAGENRTASYAFPVPAGAVGPVTLDLALRFRPMIPEILRQLGLDHLLPVEVFDMWTETRQIPVMP